MKTSTFDEIIEVLKLSTKILKNSNDLYDKNQAKKYERKLDY